jgi:hypothetical protein
MMRRPRLSASAAQPVSKPRAARRRRGFWGRLFAITATAAVLGGCGTANPGRIPSLGAVPLTGGTRIVAHQTRCDRGANAYCAIQLVVVGRRYSSSGALMSRERRYLKSLGWGISFAQTGPERAAESPGHRLRLVLATAAYDLQAVDLGWIQRAPGISRALSQTMFNRQSALSLMLESGSTS